MNIAIVGVGLIGGSLGMALKKKKHSFYHITGLGRNPKKLKLAKKLGAIDDFYLDWHTGVKDADIVAICTPVNMIERTINSIAPCLKAGAVVTDAGSVKGEVIKQMCSIKGLSFVGVHPMAGSEKSGVRHASRDLYKGATVIISKETTASLQQARLVVQMWKDAGAKIMIMSSKNHDKITAFISHFPHIVAFLMSKRLGELNAKDKNTAKLAAGSFRDLTRVANSNPADWAAICSYNRKELKTIINWFICELKKSKKKLGSLSSLRKMFEAGKIARQKLIGN
jgi:prephenate dehydrogenase